MRERIIENLKARFAAYDELVADLDDVALDARIDVPKHKSLKEHLWCVVGARESYATALKAGEWQGFNCSMTAFSASDFKSALKASAQAVVDAVGDKSAWTAAHDDLLATLAEHEVMHEGKSFGMFMPPTAPCPLHGNGPSDEKQVA
eukprot:s1_g1506.t1